MIAVATAALLLAGCDSREERAAAAAARADQLLQGNNPRAAIIEIRKAIAERDDIAPYWLLLARSQMMLQRYGAAYSSYLRVLELDRTNQEALLAAAELSFAGGQVEDADKYADQILALTPQNVRALLVKGSVALKRKKLEDADQFVTQVLQIDPSSEGGTVLRARILSAGDKDKDAAALLEDAMAARGNTQPSLSTLLEIYRKMKDDAGVERTFARLFQLSPDNSQLRLDYARELYLNGRRDVAAAVVDELQKGKPGDAALQNRIVDLWLEVGGNPVTPEEVRHMASEGSPATKVALSRYLLETGKPAEAERLLRPFIGGGEAVTGANVEPRILYAMAQNELGRRKDAFARANAVLAFDQTNPRALMLRARILMASGSFDGALNDARVLTRDNPELEAPRVLLGQVYAMRGDDGLADATFQQAMKDFPQSTGILSGYLDFLVETDRRPQALQSAARFTGQNPELAAGWKVRAMHCVALGDGECVKAALEALSTLRGGAAAARDISAALAWRDGQQARLPTGVRTVAAQVQGGQAELGGAVGQLLQAGRLADTEALVRYMIVTEPRNSLAPVLLGDIMVRRGDRTGGERQLQASIAKFPGQARAYAHLAGLRFESGDRAGAFATLEQGLNRLKGNPLLLRTMARLQEHAGQPEKAIATYRSLLQNMPDDLMAINNLAALLTDHGPRPEALGEAELLAHRLTAGDNPVFLDTRGWLKLQRGERVEAVRLLRQAVAGGNVPPVSRYHLAEALAASGDRAGAKAEAGRALADAAPGEPWVGKARALMGRL